MTDNTIAERQRRYIAKLKAAAKAAVTNGAMQARIAELEAKLKAAAVTNGVQADYRSLRGEIRLLKEQLVAAKKPRTESEEFAALQRQLKAARTRISTLHLQSKMGWAKYEEARRANPVAITKRQRNKLLHALHPDKEVSEERKKVLNDALQIFNALKWRVIED
jgi:hypothetical protein